MVLENRASEQETKKRWRGAVNNVITNTNNQIFWITWFHRCHVAVVIVLRTWNLMNFNTKHFSVSFQNFSFSFYWVSFSYIFYFLWVYFFSFCVEILATLTHARMDSEDLHRLTMYAITRNRDFKQTEYRWKFFINRHIYTSTFAFKYKTHQRTHSIMRSKSTIQSRSILALNDWSNKPYDAWMCARLRSRSSNERVREIHFMALDNEKKNCKI